MGREKKTRMKGEMAEEGRDKRGRGENGAR